MIVWLSRSLCFFLIRSVVEATLKGKENTICTLTCGFDVKASGGSIVMCCGFYIFIRVYMVRLKLLHTAQPKLSLLHDVMLFGTEARPSIHPWSHHPG